MQQQARAIEEESIIREMGSPIVFAHLVGGLRPFRYQENFLLSTKKRIIIKAGRQVGKSTMVAIKAVYRAYFYNKYTILILSPTQRQSSLLFWKIREMVDKCFKTTLIRETLTALYFDNGSQIHSLPAGHTGDTIRGFSANLIIVDEAAFVPDKVFTAVEPALAATNGDLFLLSTPFGKRGRFWDAWNSDMWEKHAIKSEECPLILKDFLQSKRNELTEAEYRQEFEGEFLEEGDAYIPRYLIQASARDVEQLSAPRIGYDYYLGVDLAAQGEDESVYTIVQVNPISYLKEPIRVVHIEHTSKTMLTDAMGRIQALHRVWNFRQIYVDAAGMGEGVYAYVKEQRLPIVPIRGNERVENSDDNKREAMYKNLKWLMEQNKKINDANLSNTTSEAYQRRGLMLELPADHTKLLLQLADLKFKYTSSGHLMVHHPDAPKAHDDFSDSLSLALFFMASRQIPQAAFGKMRVEMDEKREKYLKALRGETIISSEPIDDKVKEMKEPSVVTTDPRVKFRPRGET
jgi:hypothetical protein